MDPEVAADLAIALMRREEDERIRLRDPAEWYRRRIDTSRWPFRLSIREDTSWPKRISGEFRIIFRLELEPPLEIRRLVAPVFATPTAMLAQGRELAERLWSRAFQELTREVSP